MCLLYCTDGHNLFAYERDARGANLHPDAEGAHKHGLKRGNMSRITYTYLYLGFSINKWYRICFSKSLSLILE